jgi:hypothetical protein
VDQQEEIFGSPPPRKEIRFARGALLGVGLCLPFWILGFWVVASHF